ncbi:lipase 3-like [Plodia interpunctella]|uniref:lipase 3-like n=1 Tax=Plodia interpunctella TaxID=58824 RepID=UPI0023688F98|nr:lipase 3-like [Plodia interpunctella]
MKILVLTIGILLCQVTNVSCLEFFQIVMSKINEFADTVVKSFQDFGATVKSFMYGDTHRNTKPVHSQAIPYNKLKTERYPEKHYPTLRTDTEPTTLLSTPQLAALHGKKVESHVISTKDGYLLTLHRIVLDQSLDTFNNTVLLHHGLLGSSADWILLGANRSLPYILSNYGYDVWMINTRGNYYSRGHIEMKVDCAEYWSFSFHEMGVYDLRATVEYIRKIKNNTEKINFIGHSMGASAFLVLVSTLPMYNEYFRIAIFIAPLVYLNNIKGPLKMTTTIFSEIKDGEFFSQRKIPKDVASHFCEGLNIFCSNPLFFLSGLPSHKDWNDSFISTLIYHIPAGGSTNTIKHYQQMAASGRFHRFGDMFAEYPLSEVTVPIAMLSSTDDWIATAPDVLKLFYTIMTPVDNYVIHGRNISHTEFLWGPRADTVVFPRLLEYMKNGTNFSSMSKNEIQLNDTNFEANGVGSMLNY